MSRSLARRSLSARSCTVLDLTHIPVPHPVNVPRATVILVVEDDLDLRSVLEEILVDAGTYTYVEPQWRDWFRATAAHNTVRIDGRDQAVAAGPCFQGFYGADVVDG